MFINFSHDSRKFHPTLLDLQIVCMLHFHALCTQIFFLMKNSMRYLYDILFSKSIIWQGNDRKFRACKYVQKHIRSITTEEKEVENGLLEFMAKHFIVYTFISHHQNLLTSIASMQMQKALVFLFIFFILNYYYQFMKSFYICHNAAHFFYVCN